MTRGTAVFCLQRRLLVLRLPKREGERERREVGGRGPLLSRLCAYGISYLFSCSVLFFSHLLGFVFSVHVNEQPPVSFLGLDATASPSQR